MSVNKEASREALFARLYDLEYRDYEEDIEFYLEYARALDADLALPVLELGCGTGRISLKLAEAGFRVTGVDSSAAMLDLCEAAARLRGLLSNVTLSRADMRDLSEVKAGPFNLAFCALNTFAYLQTTGDQLSMLEGTRKLLVQHGILIVDLTPPVPTLLPPSDGEVLYQGSYEDSEEGGIVHKFVSGYAEPSRQLHHTRLMYDIEDPGGALRRVSREETFRWSSRYEMQLLLERAGYRVEQVYGGYDLQQLSDSSDRMVFVART